MTRLLLLIFLFLLITSSKCKDNGIEKNSYYTFEQSYAQTQEKESIHDLFTLLHNYGQDSIPLQKWAGYIGTNDKGMLIQYVLTQRLDTINNIFIYSVFNFKDTAYYEIKVRKIILDK